MLSQRMQFSSIINFKWIAKKQMFVKERFCKKWQTVSEAEPYYLLTMEKTLIPELR